MKNLFVVFGMLLSSFVFGQSNVQIFDYSKKMYFLYPPIDSNEIFDGSFTTEKLYITESNKDYISSDNFTDKIVNEFVVDNPSNPTELLFKSTNTKFKLIPLPLNSFDERRAGNNPFRTKLPDSIKYYLTDSDFYVVIYYCGKFIETIEISLKRFTEKTYSVANTWYNSISVNEIPILDKNKILSMWLDKTFLNNFLSYLQNKNYSDELIKMSGEFVFVFTKQKISPIFGQPKSW